VKRSTLVAFLFFLSVIRPNGQVVGSDPPRPTRGPHDVKELAGVVVDRNLAVIPNVKVTLQIFSGRALHNVASVSTDLMGRFIFECQRPGRYRLTLVGPTGFCPAKIDVKYSNTGFKGIRVTLPVVASDTGPEYCESRLKIEELTGSEGRITDH
jgi:hypothetical protein